MSREGGDKQVLSHEPVPGYGKIFLVTLGVGTLYLAIVLLRTL